MNIPEIIKDARSMLPSAFCTGGLADFPPHIEEAVSLGGDGSEGGQLADIDEALENTNRFNIALPLSADGFSDKDHEDASEAEAIHKERGFDAFAFYVSFHKTRPDGKWGIHYYEEGIRRVALLLMRSAVCPNPVEAKKVAFHLLRAHENFHFRFDLSALYDEMVLRRPLYNKYCADVYKKVFCKADCVEESLANRAMMDLRVRGLGIPLKTVTDFAREFCSSGPPGYKDFDRDRAMMKARLLGQLRTGDIAECWRGPEVEWVARRITQNCPEYLIKCPALASGQFIKIKTGGRIWIVHKNDVDHWPSKPHAHDYEHRQKLNLSTGQVFTLPPARKLVGKLRPKELESLRAEILLRDSKLELPACAA